MKGLPEVFNEPFTIESSNISTIFALKIYKHLELKAFLFTAGRVIVMDSF